MTQDKCKPFSRTYFLESEQRDKLLYDYACRVVDDMDLKEICRLMAEQLVSEYDEYTDEQLIEDIQDLYPDLLLQIK